jgi:hypothetical protein
MNHGVWVKCMIKKPDFVGTLWPACPMQASNYELARRRTNILHTQFGLNSSATDREFLLAERNPSARQIFTIIRGKAHWEQIVSTL